MSNAKVCALDPLRDPRWPDLVRNHRKASVFHTRPWLLALQRTYGYEPVAFTTSSPSEELKNAIVVCAVRSWLTGRRLVSLPFSDHCDPLVEEADDLSELLSYLEQCRRRENWKYIELRPARTLEPHGKFQVADSYFLHRLTLLPDLDILLRSFHKDSVQRKIRKAEREKVHYEVGRSEPLLKKLCGVLEPTRRRHGVPLQPLAWYRNILELMGDDACIRIASKDGRPVAGMLTLRHGQTVVYKYGGSDTSMNYLGGMALLFWRTIQEAKSGGARELDFGRSDVDNPGLQRFKEHWATERTTLSYWRCPAREASVQPQHKYNYSRRLFTHLPRSLQAPLGRILYRHIG